MDTGCGDSSDFSCVGGRDLCFLGVFLSGIVNRGISVKTTKTIVALKMGLCMFWGLPARRRMLYQLLLAQIEGHK